MQRGDIWRGCLWAYGTCIIAFVALLAISMGNPTTIPGMFLGYAVFAGIFGVVVFLPAAGLAFSTNTFLRQRVTRATWRLCALIITAWFVAILGSVIGPRDGAIWGAGLGLVASPAFWLGAVGRRWSVPLDPAGSRRDT